MARAMIEVRGVGKHYAQRSGTRSVVLENVNLQVENGEFVSLVGASGCGKTTLLRMISGLAPYDPGTVHVNGKLVKSVPPRVGFVFQDPALLPWRTIEQNVAVGLNEYRREISKQEARRRVQEQLELVGLADHGSYLPRQISGGMQQRGGGGGGGVGGDGPRKMWGDMQQRAGLARALVGQPDVLLMDEPFGALDAFTRTRLQEELAVITRHTSATTVFVTHDVDEAVFLSDRVAVMSINPGSIREIVEIDLPRPRVDRRELFSNPAVAETRDHVLELVIGARARGPLAPTR
jgi:NitT/TauT family transport system ATP-binding protein